ncbi:PREDICTED: cell wall integrity and stress response component 3-like [Acropora digitifera]|uniref:cell wall integrity and stress response component 3-like n=1 Tax=Acropora digitifera TaxID=70779 RepID=UPI00077A8C92|nr:PREDICTED: cell wall integrity and stress response component 3-like [Acropora digitifera]
MVNVLFLAQAAPKCWNSLPDNIKSVNRLNSLKRNLNIFFLCSSVLLNSPNTGALTSQPLQPSQPTRPTSSSTHLTSQPTSIPSTSSVSSSTSQIKASRIPSTSPANPPKFPSAALPITSSSSSSSVASITRPTSSSTLLTSQPSSTTPGLSTPVTEPTEPTEPSCEKDTSSNTKPIENPETFKGSLTLKEKTFTNDLEDPTSEAFIDLAKKIKRVMEEILENAKFPAKVEVLSFAKGSIICTFRITVTRESVTAEKLEEILRNASKDGKQPGPFTFEEIAVEREDKEGPTQGYGDTKDDKWLMWMIVLTAVCGVMFLLILVMTYLLCKRTRSHNAFWFDNVAIEPDGVIVTPIDGKELPVGQDEDGLDQSRV